MPRDESMVESAKQRSLRVPLDHFRHPDSLVRTKWLVSFVGAVAALGYVGWLMIGGRSSQGHASPAPLTAAHAAWNNDCQACHVDFQPLRGDTVSLPALVGRGVSKKVLDHACLKCHDAPVHHQNAKPEDVPSCATCHREHQGRTGDIVRPLDTTCVNCHRDIEHHRSGPSGLASAVTNVTGFGHLPSSGQALHPEFRSLGSDPGNIKFNHWLHLQPGIAAPDAKHKFKLSDIDASLRIRYGGTVDDLVGWRGTVGSAAGDLVRLDCVACHRPGSDDGAYVQPISYELHCRACHPLQLKVTEGGSPVEVPHRLSAQRLATVLDGLLFSAELKQQGSQAPTADETGELPLIPGRTLGKNLAQKINQDILGRRATAARTIAAKCQQCHYMRDVADGANPDLRDVVPSGIPSLWLRHARFDHSSHRHMECRSCHESAYAFEQRDKPQFIVPASGGVAARDDEQVMIAGMENCAKCHSPNPTSQGGARYDCAECHNYHGGDSKVGQAFNHSSFPGSSLGTHHPEAPASEVPSIRLAAFISSDTPTSPFVGVSSCASAGCHGDVRPGAPAWQTAFTTWADRDPHTRAYDVLWTVRAREMTRLLSPRSADGSKPPALNDEQHFAVLEQRCVGCHATPSPREAGAGQNYSLGVHCESCHGPAAGWLHSHYRTGFDRNSAPGFSDTKDLAQRAGACMPCHVGPNDAAGAPQVVDHDLIAAGHPRLAFEFRSYFERLPGHWDRRADESRHTGSFHYFSWLAGQLQQAEQQKLLNREHAADFAQFDCFACHHSIAGRSFSRTSPSGPLVSREWPKVALPPLSSSLPPVGVRLELVAALFRDAATTDTRWEAAVQSLLAARAIAGDLPPRSDEPASHAMAEFKSALTALGVYLAKDCFATGDRSNRQPTPYDSPTEFAPDALTSKIRSVTDAIQRLEAALRPR